MLIAVAVFTVLPAIFFVVTTRMAQPEPLQVFAPAEDTTEYDTFIEKPKNSLTFVLGKDDKIGYYAGQLRKDGANMSICDIGHVRQLIVERKREVGDKKLQVFISRSDASSYKTTVDLLDEMTINNVRNYLLTYITDEEKQLINKL